MKVLRDCYNQLHQILGQDIEPYESVELVEQYRRFWKPDTVRIILLAESHVFTTESDRSIPLPTIAQLPEYPTEYAKFVYCLAYGERNLTGNKLHPKRDGTPQFWKIFFSCNSHVTDKNDFKPILSGTPRDANPEHVICIGKGVASVLETDLRKLVGNRCRVIPQPNAHLSSEEHMENFRRYGEICGRD